MPKIDIPDWSRKPGGPNPLSRKNNGPYAEIVLGDLAGLDQFGVRLELLPHRISILGPVSTRAAKMSLCTWWPESSY